MLNTVIFRVTLAAVLVAAGFLAGGCAKSSQSDPVDIPLPDTLEVVIPEVSLDAGDDLPEALPDPGPEDGLTDAPPDCASTPGAFLCPCRENADCASLRCVPYLDGSVCTQSCLDECPAGWLCKAVVNTYPDVEYLCAPETHSLCKPCTVDLDCAAEGDLCLRIGTGAAAGLYCAADCARTGECPDGYACTDLTDDLTGQLTARQCLPTTASCICGEGVDGTKRGCQNTVAEIGTCFGEETCRGAEGWGDCTAATPEAEACDGRDNDCDQQFDEGFTSVDWDGTVRAVAEACGTGLCADGRVACASPDAAACSTAGKATTEACNSVDDDCDGTTDEAVSDCPSFACTGSANRYFETGVATCVHGECVSPDEVECGRYTCEGGGAKGIRCASSCEDDTTCVESAHCDPTLRICIADVPDGYPCFGNADCAHGWCANGFCCTGGDCCSQPSDCPSRYAIAPTCNDAATCQGTHHDAVCSLWTCTIGPAVEDDSACGPQTVANACAPYQAVTCTGALVQVTPACPTACVADRECRDGWHCDGTCIPDTPDGQPCDEPGDCAVKRCENGFCCAVGDCCGAAGDCPSRYGLAAACDDAPTCQGHRIDARCVGATCASTDNLPDDSGCTGAIQSNPCGFYRAVHCTGAANQTAPECPFGCLADADCDDEAHCDGTCLADTPDGGACDEPSDCRSGHCDNGLCCTGGDCCNSPTDCPATYGGRPTCLFPSTCQGQIDAAICQSHVCGTAAGTPDDSGCTPVTQAKDCGLYPAAFCTGAPDQAEPACPATCRETRDCDADAHCAGGACVADNPDGQPCVDAGDCTSDHCGNGFCCAAGDCCRQPADCPPAYTVASTCDTPATCQGTRRDATCLAATCAISEGLEDDGGCGPDVVAQDCAPYQPVRCTGAVRQIAPICGAACGSDAECQPGFHCDVTCQPDVPDGLSCDEDSDCAGKRCANGFCCPSGNCCGTATDCPAGDHDAPSCDDAATCQGHRVDATCLGAVCGRGADIPDDQACDRGVVANPCGLYVDATCSGAVNQTSPACPAACVGDADCDPAAHCDGVCLADQPDGAVCDENSDCTGGHCRNGFCCARGDCCTVAADCPPGYRGLPACDFPTTCQGTVAAAVCRGNVCLTQPGTPDDQGCTSLIASKDCGLYPTVTCNGQSDQAEPPCTTQCSSDAGCDEGAHCDAAQCLPNLPGGGTCDEDSDCTSHHCGNGFCCAAGDCCAAAGNCDPARYGQASACVAPADCQGQRRDPVCSDNRCQVGPLVDDDQGCVGQLASTCVLYPSVFCTSAREQVAPACPTGCTLLNDCDPGAHCTGGFCVANLADGNPCLVDTDCTAGHCRNGYCCRSVAGDCCDVAAHCPGRYGAPPTCVDPVTCQGHRVDASCVGSICGSTGDLPDDSGCDGAVVASTCGPYASITCSGATQQGQPTCPAACATDAGCDPEAHCDGTCQADTPDGSPCNEASDCTTGHCRNGFCCRAGDCCVSPADCPAPYTQPPTCNFPTTCQGSQDAAQCVDWMCSTRVGIDTDQACTTLVVAKECGPFPSVACSGATTQAEPPCPLTCGSDADCDGNAHCDGAACVPDVNDGSACDENSDCVGGHCANGFCCVGTDTTCCAQAFDCPAAFRQAPACDVPTTCQGTRRDAACVSNVCAIGPGLDDDQGCTRDTPAKDCSPFLPVHCSGQVSQVEPQCAATCTLDTDCLSGWHCDGTCQPNLADGYSCDEGSDCTGGHCGNGFCCATGDCCDSAAACPVLYQAPPTCDTAATCQGHRVDATCVVSRCGSTANVPDDTACDPAREALACDLYPSMYCSGLVDQSAPACAATCATEAHCDGNAHCDPPACLADLPDGAPCDEDSDCTAGHCQNGFCCAAGDCCATAANCPAGYRQVPTCTTPTQCQGDRRDAICTAGQSCEPGVLVNDDSGCAGLQASDCGAYPAVLCTADQTQVYPTCANSCTFHSDCDANAHCSGGTCQADLAAGTPCTQATDCQAGLSCVDGTCCTSACNTGLCRRCDVPGLEGTCSYVGVAQDPDGECGTVLCDGSFAGWTDGRCRDRADVPDTACNGNGGCQPAADLCPTQPPGDVRADCDPVCQVPTSGTCTGGIPGTCTNVNPGVVTCGLGLCARQVPACVNGAPNSCTPGMPAPETCNGLDDDCDGSTDAEDPDLLTNDLGYCELTQGVCSGCTKPAGLCAGGRWLDCDGTRYQACSGFYQAAGETSCDGRDNDCDGATDEMTSTDVDHCGSCGNACSNANGTTTCTNGTCAPTCSDGWKSCDGNVVNGCERGIRTLTDCGDCGVPCWRTNANPTCATGTCSISACDDLYGNCNGIDGDGCEVNLGLDTNTQATAQYLGTIRGDTGSDVLSATGTRGRWYRVTVNEDSSSQSYLSAGVHLVVPASTDYDVYTFSACSGASLGAGAGTGGTEDVGFCWDDHTGFACLLGCSDSMDVLIHVAFHAGTGCSPYTLQVTGNMAVGGCSDNNCGGCPSCPK
jgi:hypothetical protein